MKFIKVLTRNLDRIVLFLILFLKIVDLLQLNLCATYQHQNLMGMKLTDCVSTKWSVGRRRNTNLSGKDVLFMSLCVLKLGQQWDFYCKRCQLSYGTLEHQVTKFINIISPFTYENVLKRAEELWTARKLENDHNSFNTFGCALYATDVTLKQSSKPFEHIWQKEKILLRQTQTLRIKGRAVCFANRDWY